METMVEYLSRVNNLLDSACVQQINVPRGALAAHPITETMSLICTLSWTHMSNLKNATVDFMDHKPKKKIPQMHIEADAVDVR